MLTTMIQRDIHDAWFDGNYAAYRAAMIALVTHMPWVRHTPEARDA